MKFSWTKGADYGRRGPIFYESNKIQIGKSYQGKFIRANIETRVNGKGTAFAEIHLTIEWAANLKWGWTIYRHFTNSKQAGNKARAWCNYLLNNPPYGVNKISMQQKGEG